MPSERTIPLELQTKVDRELDPSERIQWIDMPVPRFFTPQSTPIFLFAIPWTSFFVLFLFATGQGDSSLDLFSVPFILVGIGLLSTPLWSYWSSLHTVYVVTNQRAITFIGSWVMNWSTIIRSYPPEKLTDIFRRDRSDGLGDVLIARISWRDPNDNHPSLELGFLNIENPKEVEGMLKQLAEQIAK